MKNTDLHTHSHYSDGKISPKELVKQAKQKNIKNLALTDHNSVNGIEEAIQEGKKQGINIIPGVEIVVNGGEMLGYFIDYKNKELEKALKESAKIIEDIKVKPTIKQMKKLGAKISYKDLTKEFPKSKGKCSPTHISMFLIKKGYTEKELSEFYSKVEIETTRGKKLSALNAIKIIRKAGGVAVLAHPWLNKEEFTENNIKKYIRAGMKGIEIDNGDKDQWGRDKKIINKIKKFAKKYSLILTKGSDYHAVSRHYPLHQLGETLCDQKIIEELKSNL